MSSNVARLMNTHSSKTRSNCIYSILKSTTSTECYRYMQMSFFEQSYEEFKDLFRCVFPRLYSFSSYILFYFNISVVFLTLNCMPFSAYHTPGIQFVLWLFIFFTLSRTQLSNCTCYNHVWCKLWKVLGNSLLNPSLLFPHFTPQQVGKQKTGQEPVNN